RLHRVRADVENNRRPRRERDGGEEEQERDRDPEHSRGMEDGPADVIFHQGEHPVVAGRRTLARKKQEENSQHENTGERDAESYQDPELGEPARSSEHKSEKPNCRRERPEKNRLAESFDSLADSGRMILAIVARLLVAPKNQDREINPNPDENRAEPHRYHVQFKE